MRRRSGRLRWRDGRERARRPRPRAAPAAGSAPCAAMIYDLAMAQAVLTAIALIAVVEGDAGALTPQALHAAVRAAADAALGVRLLSEEEMFVAGDDATRSTVLECGADVACLSGVLRRFNARLGLIAAVLAAPG